MGKQSRMVKLEEALMEENKKFQETLVHLREEYDRLVEAEKERHTEEVRKIRASLSW